VTRDASLSKEHATQQLSDLDEAFKTIIAEYVSGIDDSVRLELMNKQLI
jgi:hypothetical protein